ncbi:Wzz/FepE/Etk N-terminal domain-containing protein [Melissococcus plutonius]|uniref:YveK family protein n=1 Tax=Melissococcus plutonius TaxID=33970 RepID=UPI0021E61B31|nr:Wzz/FepE/Etk N-terminal domain-containing protein [Melissococcus plutonius]MCV2504806.1 tyrosine protein kinase [Melissococcus plutonius]MCV2519232.1 tyrosine protein kinase [Melissococcus plutonius]
MEETISIQEIIKTIKSHIGFIFVCAILGVGISGIMTFFMITPKYSSQAQLIVRLPQTTNANPNEVSANLQMINTYKDLIKSDSLIGEIHKQLNATANIQLSTEELRNSIEITQSQDSQMFTIIATAKQATTAEKIANLTANTFQQKAKHTLNVDKVTIVSPAFADMKPISPNKKINLALGLTFGLLIGIIGAFGLEFFDKTIKNEQFLSDELGLIVLGVVPTMVGKESETNYTKIKTVNTSIINEDKDKSTLTQEKNEYAPETMPTRRSRKRL